MFQQNYRLAHGRSWFKSYSLFSLTSSTYFYSLRSPKLATSPSLGCNKDHAQHRPRTKVGFFVTKALRSPAGEPKQGENASTMSTHLNKKNYSTNIKGKPTVGIINYKNIGILRNLINLEGKILSRRITCLQSKKQRQTAKAIKYSRVLGLLPFVHKAAPSQRKLRKKIIRYKSRNFIRSRRNTRRV